MLVLRHVESVYQVLSEKFWNTDVQGICSRNDRHSCLRFVERAEEFKRYLKDRRYQKNSTRTFLHFIRLLVRKAEEFGWRRPEVPDCWRGIISLAPDRGCRKIVREAIRLGRAPEQLTDRDLKAFCRSQHEQGECYARTDAWLKTFRRWVRRDGLTARFASMDSLKPQLLYGSGPSLGAG